MAAMTSSENTLKARLSAKPLIWKWFCILTQIKLIFTHFAISLVLKVRVFGLGNGPYIGVTLHSGSENTLGLLTVHGVWNFKSYPSTSLWNLGAKSLYITLTEKNDNCPKVYTLPSPDHVNLHDFDKYLKWMYNPLSPKIHIQILQTDLNTFPYWISWENLFKDQRIFSEVIILFILINFSFNNVLTLLGEIWCWPLLGPKGLICDEHGHIRQEKINSSYTY